MSSQKYTTLLLDMDGVLAEVSQSYRAAIVKTCHTYGATAVNDEIVTEMKRRGNANDDWQLSHRLIQEYSALPNKEEITLEQVTETFEQYYQGHGDTPGLCTLETLIPQKETLLELHKRSKPGIGIVTGRPRSDCMKFLHEHGLDTLIAATYCMEDGPSKPDPTPVLRVCALLGVEPSRSVVLVGDTPDDITAAVAAGCSGVGVTTPEAAAAEAALGKPHTEAILSQTMQQNGADLILPPGFAELVDLFPESE
ncbi:hypothetical protein FisN_14Lh096 [Fistulifera solaris]|uniref:Phosphoglycolate phosphatase n=1 Tax=Fistulifera solaris TaxID=1519565 RepID=A0A1Z5J9F9_FISSO|nr:hypothetical protein FisN_14Lh096 [Fistulifera solaris]|eukprot:GAX10599.1 hypothetical protein FisN_14Lh096 [Fistulifera solaris]